MPLWLLVLLFFIGLVVIAERLAPRGKQPLIIIAAVHVQPSAEEAHGQWKYDGVVFLCSDFCQRLELDGRL